jgi:hypothetical protein
MTTERWSFPNESWRKAANPVLLGLWAAFYSWIALSATTQRGQLAFGSFAALAAIASLISMIWRRRRSRVVVLLTHLPFAIWFLFLVLTTPWPWRAVAILIFALILWVLDLTLRDRDWRVELGPDSVRVRFFATNVDIPYGTIESVKPYDSWWYHLPLIGSGSPRATVQLKMNRPVRRLWLFAPRTWYLYIDPGDADNFVRVLESKLGGSSLA